MFCSFVVWSNHLLILHTLESLFLETRQCQRFMWTLLLYSKSVSQNSICGLSKMFKNKASVLQEEKSHSYLTYLINTACCSLLVLLLDSFSLSLIPSSVPFFEYPISALTSLPLWTVGWTWCEDVLNIVFVAKAWLWCINWCVVMGTAKFHGQCQWPLSVNGEWAN